MAITAGTSREQPLADGRVAVEAHGAADHRRSAQRLGELRCAGQEHERSADPQLLGGVGHELVREREELSGSLAGGAPDPAGEQRRSDGDPTFPSRAVERHDVVRLSTFRNGE